MLCLSCAGSHGLFCIILCFGRKSARHRGKIGAMKKVKTGSLRRRLSLSVAGAKSGANLLGSNITSLLLAEDQKRAHREQALEREAARFVAELGRLKGAYVKIGQMLALYGEHLLPAAVTRALHTLEAQTTSIDWPELSENLPPKLDELEIESKAFAAASLAQVHKAKLVKHKVGQQLLCVKVQYPGIANAIDDDFKHVLQMLKLGSWVKSARQLEQVTKQLKQHLLEEVDYSKELAKAQRVRAYLRDDTRYLVPQYYSDYCTSTVLTMDFIDGLDVTSKEVQALSLERRNRLAIAMLQLFFAEAFDWGLMQTDPNFGNYRILIDQEGDSDQLVLLDFGAVHAVSSSFQAALKTTILGAWQGNTKKTVKGLIALQCLRTTDSDAVKDSFAEFCMLLMEPFREDFSDVPDYALSADGLYDWHASNLLKRSAKAGSSSMSHKGFSVPPSEFMLIARKLTGVFTFVCAIKAQFNASSLLDAYRD